MTHARTHAPTDTHLLKAASSVDSFPDDIDNLEHGDGEGLETAIVDDIGVVEIQVGEHGLCKGMALQPRHLQMTKAAFVKLLQSNPPFKT